jgi:hypothetical protein
VTGYPLPKVRLAQVAGDVLTLQPRSFAAEALAATASLQPPALYECTEYIPQQGPFLVVHNHYNAPGYMAWWNVLAISAAIARHRAAPVDREVHWIITAAWRGADGGWRDRALEGGTRWVFRRVAQVYGFINMPPMPPHPDEVEERARSVMQAVRRARDLAKTGGILGLTPEGQDNPGGFGPTPPGVGDFMALLVEAGLPILPAGVGQSGSELRIRFGPLFEPHIPSRRNNRDEVVARQVMEAIARCLGRT